MKLRFGILDLACLMVLVAGIAAMFFRSRTFEQIRTTSFTTMPADDSALSDWLRRGGWQRPEIQREGYSVSIRSTSDFLGRRDQIKPPWSELGYTPVGLISCSNTVSPDGQRDALGYAGITLAIAIGLQLLKAAFQTTGSSDAVSD